MKELSNNLFLFQFFHELDVERMVKGGPWTFNQHLLLLKELGKGENPLQVSLVMMVIWVQAHDIPVGYKTKRLAKRIRVNIDARLPFKRHMKLTNKDGGSNWINFQYERLLSFCFFCGIIGHTDKF
ncbi:hypothetical protein P3X46_035060 [Hevea brasiliensis]|uniref:DUF4283 domain-containing protein n=1 Tax=Hevea brasiliensis TaxID=3981 RepID=A0ABQ9KB86_HEVBR|nr:hypothetical protein P3X46_035060 [Hevea brasiliensis]